MLIILINWLYIGITTFLTGYAILGLFARLSEYKLRHTLSYFWAGLLFVTVYAQFFSLFSGVAAAANVILCAVCAGIAVICRRSIAELLGSWRTSCKKEKWRLSFAVAMTLLMAYGTSRGYLHFDTGLYHAQSIRWIEEYGVVPGLGNLQSRFGYNSAAFALTALYSMKPILGQSLHATAGFFALLTAAEAGKLVYVFTEKRVRLSDFARIGAVFYLSVIFSEMVSPASDYYAMLLLLNILIVWLAEDEYQRQQGIWEPISYGSICILLVYAVTIKFSVAPLLLLVIKPAYRLIQQKKLREIGLCLAGGGITALPFFIRNVIISGWLIYPSTLLDFFSVDWKIPKAQADYDAAEIGAYGKGLQDAMLAQTPLTEWVGPWFTGLKALEKIFVVMTIAAVSIGVFYFLWYGLRWRKLRKQTGRDAALERETADFGFVFAVVAIAALFWFFSAPLIRYGYAYVVVLPLVTFGFFYLRILQTEGIHKNTARIHQVFCMVLLAFLLTRIKGLTEDILRTYSQPYYLVQMDYEDGEAVTQVVDGITFYVPTYRGQIGYEKFPSSLLIWPIELRGDSLEDGFRQIKAWK